MSEFIDALMKTDPEIFKDTEKMIDVDKQDPTGVTLQDMKDYFEALKQSLTEEMKKEIQATLQKQDESNDIQDVDTNNIKEE